jgi:CxxC motif-containing protein (DUF1111 family)
MKLLAAAFAASALAAAGAAFAVGGLDAVLGKALFERDWVPAPASTDAADGLGPLFAARSCAGCHAGAALAARFTDAPEGRIAGRGFVLRLGDGEGRPDPLYGRLLQTQAVQGMMAEGRVVLAASAASERGYEVSLALDRGGLAPATRQSPRVAPPLKGRAALERISEDAVLALADPDDRDGDGISGRAHMLSTKTGEALGRHGWKAETASLEEQVADAFAMDMGLSSPLRPIPHGDCTTLQPDCMEAPTGESDQFEGHELSQEMVDLVVAYLTSLPSPPPPVADTAGAALFSAAGCAACHVPSLPGSSGVSVAAYTDLLLHDMGPALDDGVGAPGIASAEWRTAPLVAMHPGDGRRYLHDGRAATIDAAILAHRGEAEAARARFLALGETERAALVAFVEGL